MKTFGFKKFPSIINLKQHALDYINVEQSLYDIKCNWVSPGPVRTDIFKKSDLTADPFEGRYRTIEAKKCAELMLHSLVNDLRNPLITDDLRAHLMGYAGHHLQSWTVKAICFLYGHDSSLQQEVQRYHR